MPARRGEGNARLRQTLGGRFGGLVSTVQKADVFQMVGFCQIDTITICRFRPLQAPASNFVITRSNVRFEQRSPARRNPCGASDYGVCSGWMDIHSVHSRATQMKSVNAHDGETVGASKGGKLMRTHKSRPGHKVFHHETSHVQENGEDGGRFCSNKRFQYL